MNVLINRVKKQQGQREGEWHINERESIHFILHLTLSNVSHFLTQNSLLLNSRSAWLLFLSGLSL